MSVPASDRFSVQEHVSRGFEAVREAFAENFAERRRSFYETNQPMHPDD